MYKIINYVHNMVNNPHNWRQKNNKYLLFFDAQQEIFMLPIFGVYVGFKLETILLCV